MSTDEREAYDLTAYLLFAEEYGWTPAVVDALPPYVRDAMLDRLAGRKVHKGEMAINDHRWLLGLPEFAEGGAVPGPSVLAQAQAGEEVIPRTDERITRYLRLNAERGRRYELGAPTTAHGWVYSDERVRIEFTAGQDVATVKEWVHRFHRLLDEGDDGTAGTREPRDPKPTPVVPSTTTNTASDAGTPVVLHLGNQTLGDALLQLLVPAAQRLKSRTGSTGLA